MWIDIRHEKTNIVYGERHSLYDKTRELRTLTLYLRHAHTAQPFAKVEGLLISTYHRQYRYCYVPSPRAYFAGIIGACEHALRTYLDRAFNDLLSNKDEASAEIAQEGANEDSQEETKEGTTGEPHNTAADHASAQESMAPAG